MITHGSGSGSLLLSKRWRTISHPLGVNIFRTMVLRTKEDKVVPRTLVGTIDGSSYDHSSLRTVVLRTIVL